VNIVEEISRRALPDRPALVSGNQQWSYGELLDCVAGAAAWLDSLPEFPRGAHPRIGLACANGVDYIVLALGILKAGGCLVPLAEELTEVEREEVIERTGLHGIVLGPAEQWRRESALPENTHRSGTAWIGLDNASIAEEAAFAALDPAFIRFSSGTTGRSKGVVLGHRALRERITAANAGLAIGPSDRVLWMLPMAHHFAVSIVLYLYQGACTILGPSHLAEDVLEAAERHRATVVYGSPFHYALLAADEGQFAWPDLRLAVSSAAPLPAATAAAFFARYGKRLVQGLGIIEVGLSILNLDGAATAATAIGRPLPDFEVELRDLDGRALPPGHIGELWIKGPGMFDAYLSPWQTLDEVCTNGWFATGDLAETDEAGHLHLRGRKKSVLNIAGMKVFPEEVEGLLNRHPAVKISRVTGHEHPALGTVPVAEVVFHEGISVTPHELIAWCRGSLSAYKVPARVRIISAITLTASGKVKR